MHIVFSKIQSPTAILTSQLSDHFPYCGGAYWGGGSRAVVSTAAFHARIRGLVPGLGGLKETKIFLPHPRVNAVL